MAIFIEELWMSVFTPGPTPVLMVATHATFAMTLPFLVYLAVSNGNYHYGFLSFICACLWASITWFVSELRTVQAQEKAEKDAKAALEGEKGKAKDEGDKDMDKPTAPESRSPSPKAAISQPEPEPKSIRVGGVGGSTLVEPVERYGELKTRAVSSSARSGVSTEDEWEKVSEDEKQKDV